MSLKKPIKLYLMFIVICNIKLSNYYLLNVKKKNKKNISKYHSNNGIGPHPYTT